MSRQPASDPSEACDHRPVPPSQAAHYILKFECNKGIPQEESPECFEDDSEARTLDWPCFFIPCESLLAETPHPYPSLIPYFSGLEMLLTVFQCLAVVLDSYSLHFQPQASPAGKVGWESSWPLFASHAGSGFNVSEEVH